ncbi:unnamed protein product [Hymenolepis diminuta]|uniref:DRBM domain-containing protein n=1 Tax=Hymenolepis diminuta TaxID=6216 RepID=A0A0R3SNE0_HYMDI|nr:unnamed protein product [Hymenolepis diminuta]
MSALNLAICLAPSLFHFSNLMGSSTSASPLLVNFSSRRRKKFDPLGGIDSKDLAEQAAAQKCLCALITYAPNIFVVLNNTNNAEIAGEQYKLRLTSPFIVFQQTGINN